MANLRKAFSKIYDQHIDKIYRFIFLKVNSQEIAQDLTSETFLRTWKKFKQEKENNQVDENLPIIESNSFSLNSVIENPRAFLYRTARNLTIDYYREKGKKQVISTEFVSIVDQRENLEEKAILASEFNTIKLALTELKEEYQNVIIWHYLDDLPIKKVAEIMDRSEEATRVLLHRALKSLKEKLNVSVS